MAPLIRRPRGGRLRRGLLRQALAVAAVRRIVLAFGLLTFGEWLLGTAVAIHAYDAHGALALGLVGFRFVPAAVAGLGTALLGDRHRRDRILTAVGAGRTAAAVGMVLALAADGPFGVVVALVWLDAAIGSAYRPAQAGLLPAVVRTPAQLTAASSLVSSAKTSGQVTGAVAGGLLVAATSATAAVALGAAVYLAACLLTARISARVATRPAAAAGGLRGQLRHMVEGIAALRADGAAGRLAAWSCTRSLMRGVWMALGVIATVRILGMGRSGFGVLMGAASVGALLAIPLTGRLVGRSHLAEPLAFGLALCAAPLAGVGLSSGAAPAIVLLGAWGVGLSLADVAVQAQLNRVVHSAELPRVVGLTESAKLLAEGMGSLLAPGLVALLGIRGALVGAGGVPLLALAIDLRGLRRVDGRAVGRVALLDLIRPVPIFAPLRVDGLEGVATQLVAQEAPAGREVIRSGEEADSWYLVVAGELDVLTGGYVVNRIPTGGSFGERGLLRGEPRSATVRARTDTSLLRLDRDAFLSAVLGQEVHPRDLRLTPPRDALEAVSRQALFGPADRATVAALAAAGTVEDVPVGHRFFDLGARDDRYLIVLHGEVDLELDDATVRHLRPGDGFGEIAVLHRVARTAGAVARTPAAVLTIPGADVRAAVASVLPEGLAAPEVPVAGGRPPA